MAEPSRVTRVSGAVLEARGLVKDFGALRAVDGVDLTVRRGEVYGFLGPNGAGKTTTMKMVLGLTRPTQGSVRIEGHDVLREPKKARASLGYLPETMTLYKTLTARQTLRFFAELRGASRGEVDERLSQVGLGDAADRRVGEFSKGMQQRLGIAQALLASPRLLVFDEPTSGLDPAGARSIRDLMRALQRQGTAIIFSSHILAEVQEVADRVAIVRKGKVVAEDSLSNLRSRLSMKGAIRMHLAEAPPSGLVSALRAVAGVSDVQVSGVSVDVVCDPGARWKVTQAAEQAGAKIRDIETRDASLEDVFLQLTTPAGGGGP